MLRLKGNINSMLTLLPCNGSDVHSHVNVHVNTCFDRMSGYNDVAALSIHMMFMLLRKYMNVNEHERLSNITFIYIYKYSFTFMCVCVCVCVCCNLYYSVYNQRQQKSTDILYPVY